MGNLWVFSTLSLPVSINTCTHDAWVQIWMGFPLGTGMDLHDRTYINLATSYITVTTTVFAAATTVFIA